jgi:hypothetical protein
MKGKETNMMTISDIQKRLKKIRRGKKAIDTIICRDYRTGKGKLTKRQVGMFREMMELFLDLNWRIAFANHKELKHADTKSIRPVKCGRAVKVAPCAKEYGGRMYFGIMVGEVALSISHSIEKDVVTVSHSVYNPAILIPELGKIVYGMESWWGEIGSEEDLQSVITPETINKIWYMRLLMPFLEEGEKGKK